MKNSDDEGPYSPPKPSRATRMFPAQSKSSARGFLIAQLKSDTALRQIIFESDRERKTLLVLLSKMAVIDIWDQPPHIDYQDRVGRIKHHTFDYLTKLENGARLAIAVKPSALVLKRRFDQEFALIRSQLPLHFADEAILVTEHSYSPAEVRNAELLHLFRLSPDPEADAILLPVLDNMTENCTIDQIVSASTLRGRAFRTIFRAIFDGLVSTDLTRPITRASVLAPRGDC